MKKVNIYKTVFSLVVVGVDTKTCATIIAPAKFEAATDGCKFFPVQAPEKCAAAQIVNCRLEPDILGGRIQLAANRVHAVIVQFDSANAVLLHDTQRAKFL